MQGVRGGDGSWVADRTHADAAWDDSGGILELGIHGPWRGTVDVQDGLPGRGRTVELSGLGMSRTCGDMDGDAGTLLPPACPG